MKSERGPVENGAAGPWRFCTPPLSPAWLEHATCSSGGCRSIQLRYGDEPSKLIDYQHFYHQAAALSTLSIHDFILTIYYRRFTIPFPGTQGAQGKQ
jgi:hypothetical protein